MRRLSQISSLSINSPAAMLDRPGTFSDDSKADYVSESDSDTQLVAGL